MINLLKRLEELGLKEKNPVVSPLSLTEEEVKKLTELGKSLKMSIQRNDQHLGHSLEEIRRSKESPAYMFVKNLKDNEDVVSVEKSRDFGYSIIFKNEETSSLWKKKFAEENFVLTESGDAIAAFGENRTSFDKGINLLFTNNSISEAFLKQIEEAMNIKKPSQKP